MKNKDINKIMGFLDTAHASLVEIRRILALEFADGAEDGTLEDVYKKVGKAIDLVESSDMAMHCYIVGEPCHKNFR